MNEAELNAIERDSITGKWMIIKFEWLNKTVHLINLYAPTLRQKPGELAHPSHIASLHFFQKITVFLIPSFV